MERRRWAGNFAIGIFVLAFVTTIVAFCSPGWLVSLPFFTAPSERNLKGTGEGVNGKLSYMKKTFLDY